jgi:aspartate kinase
VLGVCVKTDEIWIWTDVDGMMSADPHELETAETIRELSYDEVAELAHFGARVLHARMIAPLRENRIPLRIKNFYKPQQTGTIVHETTKRSVHAIKAVTSIPGLVLTARRNNISSPVADMLEKTAFLIDQNQVELMTVHQSSTASLLCLLAPTTAGPDAVHTARSALEEAFREQSGAEHWLVRPVSIVTGIGANLGQNPVVSANILKTLSSVPVIAVSYGASNCSLSIVVDPEDARRALEQIHHFILNSD